MKNRSVGIRWTIGNVAGDGFEALRLAAWGAWKVECVREHRQRLRGELYERVGIVPAHAADSVPA